MPYIAIDRRIPFDFALAQCQPDSPGALNYCITKLVASYVDRKGMSYAVLNEADGVLGCVQKEFYRRVTAPYEDRKAAEFGDVFPKELTS